jgi:transposase InsO family protein
MMTLLVSEAAETDGMSVKHACSVLKLPRSLFYRHRKRQAAFDRDLNLRERVRSIAVSHSTYGYRRVTAELIRQGCTVNHKKVLRLMREEGLLCKRKRRFTATTNSDHAHKVFPNLARSLPLTGLNQLWVADITYVQMQHRFLYLAVVLDAFSRRVIGWALSSRIDTELALTALKSATEGRIVREGLVHHSDRGVQYASNEYVNHLKRNNITVSMSRRGNPYDNAKAESFMKTLKYEEVFLADYRNEDEARESIANFLEVVYNRERLHSSLQYLTPAEFEDRLTHPKP